LNLLPSGSGAGGVIEIPGYIIKRELSSGATASVVLADQTSLDREVAIKVLAPAVAADPAQAEWFLQIARVLASFSHPNIVAVYDVGLTPAQAPFYSMQYLAGGDFPGRVERGMDEPDLTETLASIARALGYIHERGLVHRAVTPDNVLYDAYNTPVLIDFGIAPTASQDAYATSAGFALEAGRYMSPEQARGGEIGPRSDIYSLGALCFFGLTGRPPYDGVDGFAVAYAHVFEPIPRLPADKAHWQPLIDCALAKDAKDRYGSVDEFLDALTTVGMDRPAAAAAAPAAAEFAAEAPAEAVAVAAAEPERALSPARPSPIAPVPARPAWTRLWPLGVAALGLVLIAAALLIPKRPAPAPADSAPAVVTASPEPAAATAATPSNPAADASPAGSDTAAGAAADAGAAAANPPADAADASADATVAGVGPNSLDAAEAKAEADLLDPAKAPTVVDPLSESIKLGRIDLAGLRLTSPAGTNALERFQFALKLEPKSRAARQGIVDIARKYIELADRNPPDKASGEAGLQAYEQQLQHAEEVARLLPEGAEVLKEAATRRRKAAEPLIAAGKVAAEAWDKAAAKAAYERALQVDPENSAAREGIKFVATIGEPGFVFRDKLGTGAETPPMVILAGGRLALARHPVTRAEFRRFWDSGGRAQFANKDIGCRDRESIFRSSKKRSWDKPEINQDDNHPVVCVSWPEAAAYAQWIAKQSGKRYRLPTPSEFDAMVARAPRGDCATANLADAAYNRQFESRDGSECSDGFAATSPVEHYPPVAGIYDIDGNVREWVGACGNGAAPGAGAACRDYQVKGRGWLSIAAKEKPTVADSYDDDVGLNTVGFRVARDMSQ
jgi:formylglycine-generating enzyme required for sulfatase activity